MTKHRNEVYTDKHGVYWARVNGRRQTPNTLNAAWDLYREMSDGVKRQENEGRLNGLEVIILRGLPGSGKTTWAREWISTRRWYNRICKDDLRAMIHGGFYDPYLEKEIRTLERHWIYDMLRLAGPVIVDDTNLTAKHIRDILGVAHCDHGPVPVSIIDFDTPLEVCIARDAERAHPVGEARIREMAGQLEGGQYDYPGLTLPAWLEWREQKEAERRTDRS